MNVAGRPYRTIWLKPDDRRVVQLIDQRALPHRFVVEDVTTVEEMAVAIRDMHVRGAGLLGAAAGYGMYLAMLAGMEPATASELLCATRPTAVNLAWALERQLAQISSAATAAEKIACARDTAESIANEDAEYCRQIGRHGVGLIEQIARPKNGSPVNILTHCNAGWLAFVDHGSATAPIYAAHDRGIVVHVWVDETRPRNQGAKLTAWELGEHGVPHTIIADNTGGHLMQRGEVDLVLVGTDRTTYTGDVANKIGTYLKALAAKDNDVPFYVALPSSSFDWKMRDGLAEIPIEERGAEEVKHADGWAEGRSLEVRLTPDGSPAANYAFDVTPRRLITGLITERGICQPNEQSILRLFPRARAMNETGVVKFHYEATGTELTPFPGFEELNAARQELRRRGLLGVDENGIGFGNISLRDGATDSFYITGTGTGARPVLGLPDYAKVIASDFERNWLCCQGRAIASAESLTHAAVYSVATGVRVVAHGHDSKRWRSLCQQGIATGSGIAYGTSEMARDVERLFRQTDVQSRKIFAMSGHVNGIVAFGRDFGEALSVLAPANARL